MSCTQNNTPRTACTECPTADQVKNFTAGSFIEEVREILNSNNEVLRCVVDMCGIEDDFRSSFVIADWTAGSPNTLVIPQTTHLLDASQTPVVYHVTVLDQATNEIATNVDVEINQSTGDITLKTTDVPFDIHVLIT